MPRALPTLEERARKLCALSRRARVLGAAWMLSEGDKQSTRRPRERHPFYMLYTAHALRVAALVELWTLLDEKPRRTSVLSLAADMEASGLLAPGRRDQMKAEVTRQLATPKVTRLRHLVIAHRAADADFDQQFTAEQLTVSEMADLLELVCACADELSTAAGAYPDYSPQELDAPTVSEFRRAWSVLGRLTGR